MKGKKSTSLVQTGKGRTGGSHRAKCHVAKVSALRDRPKVRTHAVQAKKDKNVFRHSFGKYETVAEMQAVGKANSKRMKLVKNGKLSD